MERSPSRRGLRDGAGDHGTPSLPEGVLVGDGRPGLTFRQRPPVAVRPTPLSCIFFLFELAAGKQEKRHGSRPKRCLDKG